MKKKIILILIAFIFFSANLSVRAGGGTGVGLSFGVPTALNFKPWLTPKMAMNVNFGINPINIWTYMNLDVLYHFNTFYRAPLYTGAGIKFEINGNSKRNDNINSGLRFIGGDEIFFGSSFSIYLEGAYIFQFWPFTLNPKWNAVLGIRYYLSKS